LHSSLDILLVAWQALRAFVASFELFISKSSEVGRFSKQEMSLPSIIRSFHHVPGDATL